MKLRITFFVVFVLSYNLLFAQTTEQANSSWFGGITSQIIVVAILISLLFSFLTLFLVSKLFKDNNGEVTVSVRNYVKRKIDEEKFNRSPSRGSNNSLELQDANNRIRDLESQIEQIKKQLGNSNSTTNQTPQQPVQETKQPEVKIETLYLPSPNSDGSFDESSASSTYKEGATIYRLTKTGDNKADFKIEERDASIKLALQYRDKRIDPVCDAVNAYNPKATRIVTEQQGEAELQNGKWIKNKKAKIRYEN